MHTRPCLVGPSPEVLDSIRSQLKSRGLTEKDRRLPSIASMLVAQPLGVSGLNEGMFYAKEDLPRLAPDLAPSQALHSRPTTGTPRCLVLLIDSTDILGTWCVMGAGSWNDGGLTSGHFCGWAKVKLGWIEPPAVKRSRTLTLAPAEVKKQVCRLWRKGRKEDEYFLIENRQRVGFDRKLPRGGLLIWHIDDSEHNNEHPGDYWVGLRQADGKYK